jgi:mRNA-degrading endonuclease RelE of RelBE toxin-antitoxin system
MNTPFQERQIQRSSILKKDLKKVRQEVREEAWRIAQILSRDVFDERLSIKKLHGYRNVWRVDFMKDYRLAYTFDATNVYILRVGHRKDIYRKGINFETID